MSVSKTYDRIFLSRYDESDPFTRSSAHFLVIICMVFFTVMFLLFFYNLNKVGLFASLLSSGTSCLSASITLYLVTRGRVWAAGTLLTCVQSVLVLIVGLNRTPQAALAISVYFCFPNVILAVIYARTWVNLSVTFFLVLLVILNIFRYDASASGTGGERNLFLVASVTGIATLLMTYILANLTMRSLRLALKLSREETKKSVEKNEVITRLMDTIKVSYQDLTASIDRTDKSITSIFQNIQSQAAGIEELLATIEEISSSTASVEQSTAGQSDSVRGLSGSIKELSGLIDALHVLGSELQDEFKLIVKTALEGNESSESLDEVNRKAMENSNNIQSIAGIIDDFFEKINLLSLNAAIEAARAGEHGRGFAVVADEIGKLADNSTSELKKIKELVETNKRDMEFSSTIIRNIIGFIESLNRTLASVQKKATETLRVISQQKRVQGSMLEGTRQVDEKAEVIKNSSAEQTIAIQEVAKLVENANEMIQSNSADAQVLMESYDKLKSLSLNLKAMLFEE